MIEKEITLYFLWALSKKRLVSINGNIVVKVVINMELVRYIYEVKMEKYK